MASPVRIEAGVWDDWRFECLASECGYSLYEAIGRMAKLWSVACDREVSELPDAAIKTILGPNGAEAIIASDLGERTEFGIRLKGSGRFVPLWEGRAQRRGSALAGGLARIQSAHRDTQGRIVADTTNIQPATSREPAGDQPATSLSVSVSDSSINNPPNPPSGGSCSVPKVRKKRNRAGPTEQERTDALEVLRVLSLHSGVDYRGSDAHVDLITRQFRKGRTLLDLRKVCWHCAVNLDWKNKPEMQRYLRPETLFGPQSIEKYFDSALTAYRKEFGTDDDLKPRLSVVPGERESA